MGKGSDRHFSKEDIQIAKEAHEKMLNIISYQEDANQNYKEVLLHIHLEWLQFRKQIKYW